MSKNYYALIAGLPDIKAQDKKLLYSSSQMRSTIQEELTEEDFSLVVLLYMPFDHKNILNSLYLKKKKWDDRGNLSQETIEQLKDKKNIDSVDLESVPSYIRDFIETYHQTEALNYYQAELLLTESYFAHLENHSNSFIQEMGIFFNALNNIKVAYNGRKFEKNIDKQLIGDNELTHTLKKTRTRDFGVSTMLNDIETLIQIFEVENSVEREFKIDNYIWNYMEDLTFFHYFTIERILAFIIKLLIVERWLPLDEEKGKEMFNQLVTELQDSFQFSDEFTLAYGKRK